MKRYHPQGSLAPRDIVARAIDAEMKRTGAQCVYLDITHQPAEFLRERFPHIYETCLRYGIDMTKEPIPVVPAAHYQCGGIKTDIDGATSLPGLYAIGEVGLHRSARREPTGEQFAPRRLGHRASRLRGALTEESSVRRIPRAYSLPEWKSGDVQDVDELVVIYHNWEKSAG